MASPGLLTPAVMGLFLLAASGVLDLLFGFSGASALTGSGETVTVFVTAQGSQLFSGREHLVVGLLSLLSAASCFPLCLLPHPAGGRGAQALSESSAAGARLLPGGAAGADLPGGVRRPVPHRLLHGTAGGGVPGSGFYRLSSFAFRAGRTRRFAAYAALAIAFCLATLADRPDPARLLFYLGGAVTLFGFLLQRTAVLAAPGTIPDSLSQNPRGRECPPRGFSVCSQIPGKSRKRTSLSAGPFPYFLEDWMKRSFVSCKY